VNKPDFGGGRRKLKNGEVTAPWTLNLVSRGNRNRYDETPRKTKGRRKEEKGKERAKSCEHYTEKRGKMEMDR